MPQERLICWNCSSALSSKDDHPCGDDNCERQVRTVKIPDDPPPFCGQSVNREKEGLFAPCCNCGKVNFWPSYTEELNQPCPQCGYNANALEIL